MASVWGFGIPAAVQGAIGTGEEQRRQALAKQELDSLNQYRQMQTALQLLQIEESKRQHDLQYGPASYTDPASGQTYTAPRSLLPAVLQLAGTREKELNPEEITALAGMRERLASPTGVVKRGGIPWDPTLEAEATKKAFPEFAKEIGPLTVDQPQVNLPRSAVEKVFTEASGLRKERETQTRKDTQSLSNAHYRQVYQFYTTQGLAHPVADVLAIQQATAAYGIPPEREAFQGEPRPEKAEPKMSLEDEFLKALQKPAIERSAYERGVITQYQQGKDRNETLVGLAIRAEQGDQKALRALDIYQRAAAREDRESFDRAMQLLTQARTIRSQERGRLGQYLSDPVQEEAEISRLATQLARGTGNKNVISIVEQMTGPMSGQSVLPTTPQPTPRPAAPVAPQPTPRPAVPAVIPRPLPQAPAVGQETLSRRDPRYTKLQQRGLTDQDIEMQFGVKITP